MNKPTFAIEKARRLKPIGVKIIQHCTSAIPMPPNPNNNNQPGVLLIITGLGDDGMMYKFDGTTQTWEVQT